MFMSVDDFRNWVASGQITQNGKTVTIDDLPQLEVIVYGSGLIVGMDWSCQSYHYHYNSNCCLVEARS